MPEIMRGSEFTFSLNINKNVRRIKLKVPNFEIEKFMKWFAEDFNNKEEIRDESGGLILRKSLKWSNNRKFERIERLKLRMCKE